METLIVMVVLLVILTGFFMAFNIGAGDVANAMGTSVGSHALTLYQALFIAAIFEFLGAMIFGGQVSKTIKHGIIDQTLFDGDPMLFAWGITAALLSTAIWLQLANTLAVPVSTTNSLIGALIGFGMVCKGPDAVNWNFLGFISASWLSSPFFGAFISILIFLQIEKRLINSTNPIFLTTYYAPWIFLISSFTLFSLFAKFNRLWVALLISGFNKILFKKLIIKFKEPKSQEEAELKYPNPALYVEEVFAWLQVNTACFMAFAHGSNDVSNAIGPVVGVLSATLNHPSFSNNQIPFWLLSLGGVGIIAGLSWCGHRIINTVGHKIMFITPVHGFSAEFGAAFVILLGSKLGIPLSTTQVLIGSVIGVGILAKAEIADKNIVNKILYSWFITMPATCLVSVILNLFVVTYIVK